MRKTPIRKQRTSKRERKYAKAKRMLEAWEAEDKVCVLSGEYSEHLHTHHYLSVGAHPALEFCYLNRLQILPSLHVENAHGKDRDAFDQMVEAQFPGLKDLLLSIEPDWSRLDPDEAVERTKAATKFSHREFWRRLAA